MKYLAMAILLSAIPACSQTKGACDHSYNCDSAPTSTTKLSDAEQKDLTDAKQAMKAAEQHVRDTMDKIIESHGGFVDHQCEQAFANGDSCMVRSGQRDSDEAEFKNGWLILTKKWEKEL